MARDRLRGGHAITVVTVGASTTGTAARPRHSSVRHDSVDEPVSRTDRGDCPQRLKSLSNADPDEAGLRYRCLGHHDLQHSVPRRDLTVDCLYVATGKSELSAEAAVDALGPVYFLPSRPGGVPPAQDRQQAILHG